MVCEALPRDEVVLRHDRVVCELLVCTFLLVQIELLTVRNHARLFNREREIPVLTIRIGVEAYSPLTGTSAAPPKGQDPATVNIQCQAKDWLRQVLLDGACEPGVI